MSFLVSIYNDVSRSAVGAAIFGAIGHYGCIAAKINVIDPKIALVCGATVGAIQGFTNTKAISISGKIVAIASIIFVPFQVCKKLELDVTFGIAATTSVAISVAGFAALYMINKVC